MKTKLKPILALAFIMMCMSSCVYSLFPIYTKDNVVYLPELEGKWQLGDDPNQYVIFDAPFDFDWKGTVSFKSSDTVSTDNGAKVVVSQELTVQLDDEPFVVLEGDTIRDKQVLLEIYEEKKQATTGKVGQALDNILKDLGAAIEMITNMPNKSMEKREDKSYHMTIMNEGEAFEYEVHLARIGEDIFMDLYPTDDPDSDRAFGSMVWFPVHTFMKMELENDQLKITQFDADKMNKLFKSNLIRMSHEDVDGTVLITAKSEEIQKFFEKYARDESVFDGVDVYNRIVQ